MAVKITAFRAVQPMMRVGNDGGPMLERMTAETLMVRCHHCRRAFPTSLQVDRATLEALVMTNVYECPHCGTTHTYVKSDHFHRLDLAEGPSE